jgi:hypothetical protein
MDICPTCGTWFVQCPCCSESFCPDCKMTESEAEGQEE